jgi:transposase
MATDIRIAGRKRVRLPQNMDALHAGRDKALAVAPRLDDGRVVPGYRYKEILNAYEEAGLKPREITAEPTHQTRPPMFAADPRLAKKIVKYIRAGYPYTTVCRAVGVSRETFLQWLQRGKDGHPVYQAFYERVCRAEAKAEMDVLESLSQHQKDEWKVSAWKLERRWPEHWGRRDAFRAETQANINVTVTSKEGLGKEVANDVTSRELARRMIDGNEYGYEVVEDTK